MHLSSISIDHSTYVGVILLMSIRRAFVRSDVDRFCKLNWYSSPSHKILPHSTWHHTTPHLPSWPLRLPDVHLILFKSKFLYFLTHFGPTVRRMWFEAHQELVQAHSVNSATVTCLNCTNSILFNHHTCAHTHAHTHAHTTFFPTTHTHHLPPHYTHYTTPPSPHTHHTHTHNT